MQGPAITEFGLCKTGILDRLGLSTACAAGELTLYEITAAASKAHASTPFAFVQSKVDAVQRTYNWALSAHQLGELLGDITAGADPVWRALRNADPATLPPRGAAGARSAGCGDPQWCFVSASQFYEDTNTIFRMYDAIPNHVHFLVQARGISRAHLGVHISGTPRSHLTLRLGRRRLRSRHRTRTSAGRRCTMRTLRRHSGAGRGARRSCTGLDGCRSARAAVTKCRRAALVACRMMPPPAEEAVVAAMPMMTMRTCAIATGEWPTKHSLRPHAARGLHITSSYTRSTAPLMYS